MSVEDVKEVKAILGRLVCTHWGKRIVAAARRGTFTGVDVGNAFNWPACACGKMHRRKPYPTQEGAIRLIPEDKELLRLGERFHHNVEKNRIIGAAWILYTIEQRASGVAWP